MPAWKSWKSVSGRTGRASTVPMRPAEASTTVLPRTTKHACAPSSSPVDASALSSCWARCCGSAEAEARRAEGRPTADSSGESRRWGEAAVEEEEGRGEEATPRWEGGGEARRREGGVARAWGVGGGQVGGGASEASRSRSCWLGLGLG